MKKIEGSDKVFFGFQDGERIYISKPTWDCDWYWSFGYLGNTNCHFHLDGIDIKTNMYDAIKENFTSLNKQIKKNIWLFCELSATAYTLIETAEVLGRGGSHYTGNPLKKIIKNKKEVERINNIVLPNVFNEINKIYDGRITNIKKKIEEK